MTSAHLGELLIAFLVISGVILFYTILFCLIKLIGDRYCNRRGGTSRRNIPWGRLRSQQHQRTNPIYNISGAVQNQERAPRYPAEAFLSVNHIQTHFQNTNETNKPSTINDAPPSYEEAIKMVHTTTTTTTTTVIPAGVHRSPLPLPPQTE